MPLQLQNSRDRTEGLLSFMDLHCVRLVLVFELRRAYSFQVPSTEIDKVASKFFTHWDPDTKMFTVSELCSL
jgi:hypothetical protein